MPAIEIATFICTAVLAIGSLWVIMHTNQTGEPTYNDYWYDFWNYYNSYTEIHNDYIDSFVISKCQVNNRITLDHNKQVPAVGTYTLRYKDEAGTNLGSVGIIKSCKRINNRNVYSYQTYSTNQPLLDRFTADLVTHARLGGEVEVMSIDTSGDTPTIVRLTRICKDMKPSQAMAIDEIIANWNENSDFNSKIMIYGERGLGKTYIGKLLKKYIERENPGVCPLLFDDFNPSSIAVNINTMILQKSSEKNPVIVVINEIDRIYDKILNGQEAFDHRLQHSRNVQEFHNMLDNIGNKRHVIAIYTMEKNPHELRAEAGEYASFMRPGRVDYFIHLQADEAKRENH
jgi:hypothetical protein